MSMTYYITGTITFTSTENAQRALAIAEDLNIEGVDRLEIQVNTTVYLGSEDWTRLPSFEDDLKELLDKVGTDTITDLLIDVDEELSEYCSPARYTLRDGKLARAYAQLTYPEPEII